MSASIERQECKKKSCAVDMGTNVAEKSSDLTETAVKAPVRKMEKISVHNNPSPQLLAASRAMMNDWFARVPPADVTDASLIRQFIRLKTRERGLLAAAIFRRKRRWRRRTAPVSAWTDYGSCYSE